MFFTKFPHPANFSFAEDYDMATGRFRAGSRTFESTIESYEGGVHHVQVRHADWGENRSIVELTPPAASEYVHLQAGGGDFNLELSDRDGSRVLGTTPTAGFGVCGSAWMFQFSVQPGTKFYGMGEKNFGRLELSGIRTKFWNTDVWGDFPGELWSEGTADPPYLSVPYLVVKQGDVFIGLLLHTPSPAFFETPGLDKAKVFPAWQSLSPQLLVGAESGQPDLWIIYGPTLKELTRKLQKLVGVTPVPPIWSLGYHQSRWGYAGHKDLLKLDAMFTKNKIPCDGLWLDIDYMDGFRVFTLDGQHFPAGLEGTAQALAKSRRKVVAILDPGVKKQAGYEVYDDLKAKRLYCLNREGKEYVGMVWPGETIFPDLTLEACRNWWAARVTALAKQGLSGVWLDMNDPSTGPVDPSGMRFRDGKDDHALHRNQYALGMQMASHAGFLKSDRNRRPFLLTRSGSIGTSRYSAVWTGDNLSNYFYLRMAIPATLNLGLSGIPFNGPDVGGFGGNATEQLFTDWVKTCFLFPFMRNHNSKESADQEPWAFSPNALQVARKFIRLRYKFLPYLYNLFCEQEEHGDPVLRPLLYEFASKRHMPLDSVSDQFMVGPWLLQAPILDAKKRERKVLLPGRDRWFDASAGAWLMPGLVRTKPSASGTPLYIRDGAIVPLQSRTPTDNMTDLRRVDFLVCASPDSVGKSSMRYRADDGESFDYLEGRRTEVEVGAQWSGRELSIEVQALYEGFGPLDYRLLVPKGFDRISVNGKETRRSEVELELTGEPLVFESVPGEK